MYLETEAAGCSAPKTYSKQFVTLFQQEALLLDNGQLLHNVRVAYHAYGPPRAQATLVLHALTGDSAAHSWWPTLVGAGKALDVRCNYIICSNVLGGCAGSSGMRELDLQAGSLSLRDMVRVQRELLRALGVERVTLVGGSMGGMLAYAWLSTFPDLIERAVIVAAPARHSPWAIGLKRRPATPLPSRQAVRASRWRGNWRC